jgi:hypothetical protein
MHQAPQLAFGELPVQRCQGLLDPGDASPVPQRQPVAVGSIGFQCQPQLGAQFRFQLQELTAGPGQLVLGPREVPHTCKAGPDGARVLVLITPAGFEQMFQEGGVPAHDTTTPPAEDYDIAKVTALAAKYGFEVVGPPLG